MVHNNGRPLLSRFYWTPSKELRERPELATEAERDRYLFCFDAAAGKRQKAEKEERKNALKKFTSNDAEFLVVTDVSLKDLNLERVSVIINFDLPSSPEAYLDRQFLLESKGLSFVFCSLEEKKTVRAIEGIIEKRLLVEKNHPFNDDLEEFVSGVRRPSNVSRKSRKSEGSKKKKKRWY